MAVTPSHSQAPVTPGLLAVDRRSVLFWALFALTLVLAVALNSVDVRVRTPAAPRGIISYEFAADVARGQAIIDSWTPLARNYASFQLGLDYLYMPSYALTIALGCLWAALGLAARARWLADLGRFLALGQGLAALLDATENAALLRMLFAATAAEPWRGIAFMAASVKFALVVSGLLFVIAGVVSWFVAKFAGR